MTTWYVWRLPPPVYPDGQLNPDDDGEIDCRVGLVDGRVVMEFLRPVKWIGLTSSGARELAAILIARADAADGGE